MRDELDLALDSEEAQASLVAGQLVEIAASYFTLSEAVLEGCESGGDLTQIRTDASALTARAATLLREARQGALAHLGHGCDHEAAFNEIGDFLTVLLEAGAGLLEVPSFEQINQEALAHPFGHFVPLITGTTRDWLFANVDEEQAEQLAGFITRLGPLEAEPDTRLVFGPISAEALEALSQWFEADGPHEERVPQLADEIASRLAAGLLALHDQTHADPASQCPGFGDVNSAVCVVGDFDAELVVDLLVLLRELELPYRLEDRLALEEGLLVTVWAPGMDSPLTRRALEGGPRYQLDARELATLEASGADVEDVAAYLSLDLRPGLEEIEPAEVERLGALAELTIELE